MRTLTIPTFITAIRIDWTDVHTAMNTESPTRVPFDAGVRLRSFGARNIPALLLGIVAAILCVWLRTPLPWMIGPLVAVAVANMAGARLAVATPLRNAGQWVIGVALGLYFTPVVVQQVAALAAWIALGVVFAIALGAAGGVLLTRCSGVDTSTAFFSMAIGGASEMANQAERHDALVDRVAAAHSLRILMVVVIVPFAFKFAGVHGLDPYLPGARHVDYGGLLLLALLTSAFAWLIARIGSANPWVIGPMFATIALTAASIELSALPQWIVNAGQLLIGCALGSRFSRGFVHTAPRFMASVAAIVLVFLVSAGGFGFVLSALSGIALPTALLATSPGGIAEMSLTAKTLQLGVPIVTAFHVVRMSAVVLLIGPIWKLVLRWNRRDGE